MRERTESWLARVRGHDDDAVPKLVFGLYLVAALVYVQVFVPGTTWFAGDDWYVLTDQPILRPAVMLEGINGHWVLLPRTAFGVLWSVFGLHAFGPYKLLAVVTHGVAAVLLRAVMRRSGVRPWAATIGASLFVLLGAGAENIVWPFQMPLSGALAFGLAHLLLADHPDPVSRRDLLAVAVGLGGALCCGFVVPMSFAVGLAVLLRRGWIAAIINAGVPVGAYLAWLLLASPGLTSGSELTPSLALRFAAEGQEALLTALTLDPMLTLAYALTGIVGTAILLVPAADPTGVAPTVGAVDGSGPLARLRTHALPVSLWCSSVVFNVLVARNVGEEGPSAVWAMRYVYLGVAVALPLLTLAADTVARRVPRAAPVIVVLALLPVPASVNLLRHMSMDPMDVSRDEHVMRTALRMPFIHEVDRSVKPFFDPFHLGLDVGFLLDTEADGKLDPSTHDVPVAEVGELRVRLGLNVRLLRLLERDDETAWPGRRHLGDCVPVVLPSRLRPDAGAVYEVHGRVDVSSIEPDGTRGTPVPLGEHGPVRVQVELADLELALSGEGTLCRMP